MIQGVTAIKKERTSCLLLFRRKETKITETARNGSSEIVLITDERHRKNWRTIAPSATSCQFLPFYSGYCCVTNSHIKRLPACRLGIIAESWHKGTTAKRPIHDSTDNQLLDNWLFNRNSGISRTSNVYELLSCLNNRRYRNAGNLYSVYEKKMSVHANLLYITWV